MASETKKKVYEWKQGDFHPDTLQLTEVHKKKNVLVLFYMPGCPGCELFVSKYYSHVQKTFSDWEHAQLNVRSVSTPFLATIAKVTGNKNVAVPFLVLFVNKTYSKAFIGNCTDLSAIQSFFSSSSSSSKTPQTNKKEIKELTTKKELKEYLEKYEDQIRVIQWYMPGCGPCVTMSHIMEKQHHKHSNVAFAKIAHTVELERYEEFPTTEIYLPKQKKKANYVIKGPDEPKLIQYLQKS